MNDYGVVTATDTVRLQRLLPGPVEKVWAYLTDSELRGAWLATGDMDLRVGGAFELRFFHADLSAEKQAPARFREYEQEHRMRGTITRCDPPTGLSYTWGDRPDASEVSFDLAPQGESVLLTVTHRRLATRGEMMSVSPGWHAHLAVLGARLQAQEPPLFWSTFQALESEYERLIP